MSLATDALRPVRPAPELTADWHLRERGRHRVLLALLMAPFTLLAAALALLYGVVPLLVLLGLLIVAAIVIRPRVGLLVVFGLMLVFEQLLPEDPLMLPGYYLHSSIGTSTGTHGIAFSPLEILLAATVVSWLVQGLARRKLDFQRGTLFWPLVLFAVALIFGLARGALANGDMYVGSWEIRSFAYLVVSAILAANLLRTRQDLDLLTGLTIAGVGLYAVEGAWRKIALINQGSLDVPPEFAYGHEAAVFLSLYVLLVMAQRVFGGPRWQRILGPVLLPVVAYTSLASGRRAVFAVLGVAVLAMGLVFLVTHRRAFLLVVLPVVLGGALYLPLFWNSGGLIGQPARAVRSVIAPDARDLSSDLYRALERVDVRATIANNTLLGVGFGRQFEFAVPLPDLSWWPFWRYEPHMNVMWVWFKTGALGFVLFWVLIGGAIARAAWAAKAVTHPHARVFGLLALTGLVGTMTFSYLDLGLVSGRLMVFLGVLIGVLGTVDRVALTERVAEPVRARRATRPRARARPAPAAAVKESAPCT